MALLQETLTLLNLVELEGCPECLATSMVDHILVSPSVSVADSGAIPGCEPQHPIIRARDAGMGKHPPHKI